MLVSGHEVSLTEWCMRAERADRDRCSSRVAPWWLILKFTLRWLIDSSKTKGLMIMAYTMDASETIESAEWLKTPGVYHFQIERGNENPMTRDNRPRGGFALECSVLAGPQDGAKVNMHANEPNLSHKDGGEFAKKVQTRILVAIGMLNENHLGKRVSIEIEKDAPGRQFIARMDFDDKDTEKKYLGLAGAQIWHIDDPSAPPCDRNLDAIKLLPANLRRDPASFKKKDSGNGGSAGSAAANKPAPPSGSDSAAAPQTQVQQPAAAAAGVNLDDL